MEQIEQHLIAYLDTTPDEFERRFLPTYLRNVNDCVALSLRLFQHSSTARVAPVSVTTMTLEPMCKYLASYINSVLSTRHPSIQIQRELERLFAIKFDLNTIVIDLPAHESNSPIKY